MKQYKTVNNLVGWITFLIAATVYCMTIEPFGTARSSSPPAISWK